MTTPVPTLYEQAQQLAQWVYTTAGNDGKPPVSIAVVDAHGDLLCFHRCEGSPARTVNISLAKAYTVTRMLCSTVDFRARLVSEGLATSDFMDAGLTSLPGGVGLKHNGKIIGAVGISGRSLNDDHDLALAASEHFNHL